MDQRIGLVTLGIDDMKLDMKLDQVSGCDRWEQSVPPPAWLAAVHNRILLHRGRAIVSYFLPLLFWTLTKALPYHYFPVSRAGKLFGICHHGDDLKLEAAALSQCEIKAPIERQIANLRPGLLYFVIGLRRLKFRCNLSLLRQVGQS